MQNSMETEFRGEREETKYGAVAFAVIATIMSVVIGAVMAGWRGTFVGGSLGALLSLVGPATFMKVKEIVGSRG